MLKEIILTDRIKGLIAKSFGDEQVNFDALAAFEAVAATKGPIKHKGGLFKGATLGTDTLVAMNEWVNVQSKYVPLQLMHRSDLPAGKIFATELRAGEDNEPALHSMFYIPRGEEGDKLIAKINTGVIAQVSVGIQTPRILCSKCGWDYLGPSATFDHIYDLTCENGHTIGEDNTRTNLSGLDDWMEMSLVDRGAIGGADILPRPKQTFSATGQDGFDRKGLRLFACAGVPAPVNNPSNPNEAKSMQELVDAKVALALADKTVADLKAAAETTNAELVSLRAKVADLEAKLASGDAAKVSELTAELSAANTFLENAAKAMLLATGKANEAVPADVAGRVALIESGRTLLSLAIPPGGASRGTGSGAGQAPGRDFSAFIGKKG